MKPESYKDSTFENRGLCVNLSSFWDCGFWLSKGLYPEGLTRIKIPIDLSLPNLLGRQY